MKNKWKIVAQYFPNSYRTLTYYQAPNKLQQILHMTQMAKKNWINKYVKCFIAENITIAY